MARQPQADEVGEHFRILRDPPELLVGMTVDGAGIAGADRIDEDHVRDIQRTVGVVHDIERRRTVVVRIARHAHSFRAEQAHVQPHRRRARTAVEREHDGAVLRISASVDQIAGREDARLRLAFEIGDIELFGDCAIAQLPAGDLDLVLRDEGFGRRRLLRRICRRCACARACKQQSKHRWQYHDGTRAAA